MDNQNEKKHDFKLYLLCAIALFFGLFAASILFKYITKASQRDLKVSLPKKPAPAVIPAPVSILPQSVEPIEPKVITFSPVFPKHPRPVLIVNGVFFSQGQQSCALINNRIVEEGDTIEGLKVVRISLHEVVLESPEGLTTKLAIP